MIVQKNTYKYFLLFLTSHLLIWTFIPTFTNVNLPLDTIEALAWGSDLKWGFNKHPPFSAFAVEVFFKLFGNQDWAFYLLSQIFVISAFFIIFLLAKEFFKENNLALYSVLFLESIIFYNFTTPEFNVNVSQLPFWALSIFLTWRCLKRDKITDYIFLGIVLGLGILSKYLFIYLIFGIKCLFIFKLFYKKKFKNLNFLIVAPITLTIITPHLMWLFENNFLTLTYGLQRASGSENISDHFILPITFIFKQLGILIPFFIMGFFLIKKLKIKKNFMDEKMIFLFFTSIFPILLIILTSIILGAKIRTMWMTPFYLVSGILLVEIYKNNINKDNIKKFYFVFSIIFFLSPLSYLIVSLSNDFKRTDYPGKEISRLVQNKWDNNFKNDISYVIGDEWFAGNLSYHLPSRPKWINNLDGKANNLDIQGGVIYTGNPKILKKICPGIFGTIKPVGYCMIGKK